MEPGPDSRSRLPVPQWRRGAASHARRRESEPHPGKYLIEITSLLLLFLLFVRLCTVLLVVRSSLIGTILERSSAGEGSRGASNDEVSLLRANTWTRFTRNGIPLSTGGYFLFLLLLQ